MAVEQKEISQLKGLRSIQSKSAKMTKTIEKGLMIPWNGVRPDLMLHKGARDMDGNETYVVEDPVRGDHFELGEAEARFFMCLVTESDLNGAIDKLLRTTSLRPDVEDIQGFLRMLQKDQLAVLPADMAIATAGMKEKKKPSAGAKMAKGYMFFKIPILRPNPLLDAIYPWLKPLWSRPFVFLYAVMGLVGLVFVAQQIELYLHNVSYLFTPRGAALFFLALSLLKIMHEFGHALAARHYNLHVRRMGLAFMVFMPILYTDVTDAWKLPSRRARMIIGAGGMMVEICVAAVSLFFWTILPDGIAKSLMFYMSGVSLLSTVMINLNPLMRFDGYYILMDYLRISNLRKRSLEMFKYYSRRILYGWRGDKPEEHPWEQGLVFFGIFSIIYRFIIFFSITLMMYHLVPKAIGLPNLLFAMGFLFLMPLFMEIYTVLKQRKNWGSPLRLLGTLLATCCLIGLLFVPFPRSEKLPGFFLYQNVAQLEASGKGRIATVLPELGAVVEKGDMLVKIQDDALEQNLKKQTYDMRQIEATLKNMGGGGEQGGYRKWLIAERERLSQGIEKTKESLAQLEIRAPISGRVLDVNETLQKGSYVYKQSYLATVGNDDAYEVRAYAREKVFGDFKKGGIREAHVIFQDLETTTEELRFREMHDFPVSELPNDSLFDYAGGSIISVPAQRGKVRPKLAYYPLVFSVPQSSNTLRHGTPCWVEVDGKSASVMDDATRLLWRVMASEGIV